MEIRGLERHANLQQYVNDIELRLAEYEQGKCSFEKVAINFRWSIEYILREYQKEYPGCAAEDTFNTIKNLQDMRIIDRSTADVFHQVRKIGNKGGAHLTEETMDAAELKRVFAGLVNYIPAFLTAFPEPSKKAAVDRTAIRIDAVYDVNEKLKQGSFETIEICERTFMGYCVVEETELDEYTEINDVLYYNVNGVTKTTRAVVNEFKTRKYDNTYVELPGVAQVELGYSAVAYCCVPESDGYRVRNKRYFDYCRPNKLHYLEVLAHLVQTINLPACFAEDAFDAVVGREMMTENAHIVVEKRGWYDTITKYEYYKDYDKVEKFGYVKKIILPENLQPACLSWLNLFPNLEELVLPSSMYMQDGVIYRKMGNQILALLRNRVNRDNVHEVLRENPNIYICPGADWGSGFEIRNRVDGSAKYLETEAFVRGERISAEIRRQREEKRQEEEYWKEYRERQKAQKAAQEQQQKAAQQTAQTKGGQQQKNASCQTGSVNRSKRLCKSRTDRLITGVCGGIAGYLGVPSSIVRLVFGMLGLSGLGFWGYVLLALFLPNESDD